jgi:hypothetical protein
MFIHWGQFLIVEGNVTSDVPDLPGSKIEMGLGSRVRLGGGNSIFMAPKPSNTVIIYRLSNHSSLWGRSIEMFFQRRNGMFEPFETIRNEPTHGFGVMNGLVTFVLTPE